MKNVELTRRMARKSKAGKKLSRWVTHREIKRFAKRVKRVEEEL